MSGYIAGRAASYQTPKGMVQLSKGDKVPADAMITNPGKWVRSGHLVPVDGNKLPEGYNRGDLKGVRPATTSDIARGANLGAHEAARHAEIAVQNAAKEQETAQKALAVAEAAAAKAKAAASASAEATDDAEDKAAKEAADFVEASKRAEAASDAENSDVVSLSELKKQSRPHLNILAEKYGLDPTEYRNAGLLAEALYNLQELPEG